MPDRIRLPALLRPLLLASAFATCASPAGAADNPPVGPVTLSFYGGRVLANALVIKVIWGTGVDPAVAADGAGSLGGLYRAVLGSSYLDTLAVYDTIGLNTTAPKQIGRGVYAGTSVITPATAATSLTDTDIQSELKRQIAAGKVPAPTANTYYAVFLPPSITVTNGPARSCANFCAYHGTGVAAGRSFAYGVHLDLGHNGCETGCGAASVLQNTMSEATRQLVNAITDPDVGRATSLASPIAWYDGTSGLEAGSACDFTDMITSVADGQLYTVEQFLYPPNPVATQCVTSATRPTDFAISAPNPALKLVRGYAAGTSLRVAMTAGAPTRVTLRVLGLPAGITASLSAGSVIDTNATVTFRLKASTGAAPGVYEPVISATGAGITHSAALLVTVK